MVIVVLGYTGSIGGSILDDLIKSSSFKIICVGRKTKNKPYLNPNIKYHNWDFNSFKSLDLLFLKKADVIINCVGKMNNSLKDLENTNFIFIQKLLKYISVNKLKVRLIHLGSVAVYGGEENYFGRSKIISENSKVIPNDLYSNSKFKGDLIIQNAVKKNLDKKFSYTILRITNVFGNTKKSNLYKYLLFSLHYGIWIRSFENVFFNFINVKDVSQAVLLTIFNLKVSRNKIYIVSDDCKQNQIYQKYQNFFNKKIIQTQLSINVIRFFINYFPIPKKLRNLLFLISNRVSYSNKKIKNEINFKPKFSLRKKIKLLNE
ncbi:NAD-dependent epimerase/dehydratase family protein [Candidatus Pelagibacter sp. HIMB1587]|uniref:NAD-dependent epimerase/dehydratase family protein n=1 Tax=Candidatus Pelagibacter sp. HIMB1587 TaxID=3413354 RepID=UPI003F85918D